MNAEIPVQPGSIIAGRYRVEEVLGKGQMGVIVAATHIGLNRRYAVKFLAHAAASQEHHERFLREARAAVQLESAHVARVFDVGTLDDGAPYMVMELLKGRDLAAVLQERGPLPISEAVEYVLHACEAIGEAHRARIVHRDIKPANLFLTTTPSGEPCVKVLDFGVSKVNEADGEGIPGGHLKLTRDRQLLGSPLYMPPEQLTASKDVDARSDIWSLGVTLYELCTGSTPFVAENFTGLTTAVLVKPPVPMSRHRPDVPAAFEAVVLQCMNKERDMRWPSVGAFANALAPFAPARAAQYAERIANMLGEELRPARPTAVLAIPTEPEPVPATTFGAGSTSAIMSPVPPPAPARRRRTSALVAGGVLLAATALGIVAVRVSARSVPDPSPAGSGSVVPVQAEGSASSGTTSGPTVSVSATASTVSAPTPPTAEPIASAGPSAMVTASAPAPRPRVNVPVRRPSAPTLPPPSKKELYTQ